RRQNSRLPLESRNTFGIVTEGFRQEFDRNAAAQFGIGGLIYIAHTARPQMRRDFVVGEFGSDHSTNEIWSRILSNKPMSFTDLRFLVDNDEKESQWPFNRVAGNLRASQKQGDCGKGAGVRFRPIKFY